MPGKYVSYWRLHNGREFFGISIWVEIVVAEPTHEDGSDERPRTWMDRARLQRTLRGAQTFREARTFSVGALAMPESDHSACSMSDATRCSRAP